MAYTRTEPEYLAQTHRFRVEVDGFEAALFQTANLPEFEVQEVNFNPGGSVFAQKAPGRITYSDVVLEKGIMGDGSEQPVEDWLEKIIQAANGTQGKVPDVLKDINVMVLNNLMGVVKTYTLHGCFVKSATLGALSGEGGENIINSVTLAYQYFSVE